jgi:antitoxin component YwqK of YwqJK toxin-antitoxin module
MLTEEINQYNSNGLKHGLWRDWHHTGELWFELTYVNGVVEGVWRTWYKNGELMWVVYYVNGIQEGEDVEYRYTR